MTPALSQLLEDVRSADVDELPQIRARLAEAESEVLVRMMKAAVEGDRKYTLAEVAQRLNMKVSRVREMARRGELPTIATGRRGQRVSAAALTAWERNGGAR